MSKTFVAGNELTVKAAIQVAALATVLGIESDLGRKATKQEVSRMAELQAYADMHMQDGDTVTLDNVPNARGADVHLNNVSGFSMSDATLKKVRPLSNTLAESFGKGPVKVVLQTSTTDDVTKRGSTGKRYARKANESYECWQIRVDTMRAKDLARKHALKQANTTSIALAAYTKLGQSAANQSARNVTTRSNAGIARIPALNGKLNSVDPIEYALTGDTARYAADYDVAQGKAGLTNHIALSDMGAILADDIERANMALLTSIPLDKQGSRMVSDIQSRIIDAPQPHAGMSGGKHDYDLAVMRAYKTTATYADLVRGKITRADGKVLTVARAMQSEATPLLSDRTSYHHAGSYPSPDAFKPTNVRSSECVILTCAQFATLPIIGAPQVLGDSAEFAIQRDKDNNVTSYLALERTLYPSQNPKDYIGHPFYGDSFIPGKYALAVERQAQRENTVQYRAPIVDNSPWAPWNDKPPITREYLASLDASLSPAKVNTATLECQRAVNKVPDHNTRVRAHAAKLGTRVMIAPDRTPRNVLRGIVVHGLVCANVARNLPR